MSVLIKGLEMPTSCSECAFCGYYGNGEHMCDIIEKAVEYESAKTSRRDDCPLIPVPEHGDLIDADKLVELCDIMADKCDGIGVSIWHQFKTTVEWSPIVIPAEEGE